MLKMFPSWVRGLSLVLILAGAAIPGVANAKAPAYAKGIYTTTLLITQAANIIPGAGGSLKVGSGKFVLTGLINNAQYKQTITLSKSGVATLNPFLPGFSTAGATGTYRAHGKNVTISASVNGGTGNMTMTIMSSTFGSTLTFSSKIIQAGQPNIYVTFVGGSFLKN